MDYTFILLSNVYRVLFMWLLKCFLTAHLEDIEYSEGKIDGFYVLR